MVYVQNVCYAGFSFLRSKRLFKRLHISLCAFLQVIAKEVLFSVSRLLYYEHAGGIPCSHVEWQNSHSAQLSERMCTIKHMIVWRFVFGHIEHSIENFSDRKPFTSLLEVAFLYVAHSILNEVSSKPCLTLRWLMSYIYGAPILDVSRSHTTTQHSR